MITSLVRDSVSKNNEHNIYTCKSVHVCAHTERQKKSPNTGLWEDAPKPFGSGQAANLCSTDSPPMRITHFRILYISFSSPTPLNFQTCVNQALVFRFATGHCSARNEFIEAITADHKVCSQLSYLRLTSHSLQPSSRTPTFLK